jgi:YidC/Oxa1 family membrane protein insertase
MNIKEWIFPLALAISSTFLIQYFMAPRFERAASETVQSGQSFVAPVMKQINKPLLLDIDFVKERDIEEILHTVSTQKGTYVFSSKGAILKSFEFPWQKNTQTVGTIATHADCFMVGLSEQTPLFYDFVSQTDAEKTIEVKYQAEARAGLLVKTFTLYQDSYVIDIAVELQTDKSLSKPEQIRLSISNPVMTPGVKSDVENGLVNTIGSGNSISLDVLEFKKNSNMDRFWYTPKTFGFASQFLIHALLPTDIGQASTQRAYFKKETDHRYVAILESPEFESAGRAAWSVYIGPKTVGDLNQSAPFLIATLNYGWFAPISKAMLYLLNLFNDYLGSYGWAIILLTFLLKLLLMPFMMRGEKSMRSSQDFGKKMEYIKQKYKNNPEALQQAQAELIKKHGMPGIGGCLPMLLNIPVLFGLNKVLSSAIELHGAPFLWISNLSAPDPYYILSVIVAVGIVFSPMGVAGDGIKQRLFKYCFALFLGAVTSYFASGLALFVIMNSLMSILQTNLQKRLG